MEKKQALDDKDLELVVGGKKKKNCEHENKKRISNYPPTYRCEDCGAVIYPE